MTSTSESRAAHGLSPVVEDAAVLARVAALVVSAGKRGGQAATRSEDAAGAEVAQ